MLIKKATKQTNPANANANFPKIVIDPTTGTARAVAAGSVTYNTGEDFFLEPPDGGLGSAYNLLTYEDTTGAYIVNYQKLNYVYLGSNNLLHKFDAKTGVEDTSGNWPVTLENANNSPAVDQVFGAANGDVLIVRDATVTATTSYYFERFDPSGTKLWGTPGYSGSYYGIAELSDGTILLGDSNGMLHGFDGTTGTELGAPFPFTPASGATGSLHVNVDSSDNIYVYYSSDWTVHKWTSSGTETWVSSPIGGGIPAVMTLTSSDIYIGRWWSFGKSDNYYIHQVDPATGSIDNASGWPYTGYAVSSSNPISVVPMEPNMLAAGNNGVLTELSPTASVVNTYNEASGSSYGPAVYDAGTGYIIYTDNTGSPQLIAIDTTGAQKWATTILDFGPFDTAVVV